MIVLTAINDKNTHTFGPFFHALNKTKKPVVIGKFPIKSQYFYDNF
jgi:hypothetical protein